MYKNNLKTLVPSQNVFVIFELSKCQFFKGAFISSYVLLVWLSMQLKKKIIESTYEHSKASTTLSKSLKLSPSLWQLTDERLLPKIITGNKFPSKN